MIEIDALRQTYRGTIRLSEPLGPFTWMKVGGPADYYAEPADVNDLRTLLKVIHDNHLPYLLIGRGSNMLVSDEGYRGVVINLEEGLNDIGMEEDLVHTQAGVRITKFVDFCVQHSLAGVEMLAGIPGTMGGAIVMNAGAHGGETADHLEDVDVLRGEETVRIPKGECGFSYRHSSIAGDVVIGARFRLSKGEKATLIETRKELIRKRNASQPLELPNLGSMFKNPPGSYAARLIEQAGLKGKRIGDAQVSEKHSNFMVNHGHATGAQVLQLIDLVKRTVYQNSGVHLELEVRLVGFPQRESAA